MSKLNRNMANAARAGMDKHGLTFLQIAADHQCFPRCNQCQRYSGSFNHGEILWLQRQIIFLYHRVFGIATGWIAQAIAEKKIPRHPGVHE